MLSILKSIHLQTNGWSLISPCAWEAHRGHTVHITLGAVFQNVDRQFENIVLLSSLYFSNGMSISTFPRTQLSKYRRTNPAWGYHGTLHYSWNPMGYSGCMLNYTVDASGTYLSLDIAKHASTNTWVRSKSSWCTCVYQWGPAKADRSEELISMSIDVIP